MPLIRYFLVCGAALLTLLFISDAYLPKPDVVASSHLDAPIIRIHSDRKAPELVVYDTAHPPVVTPQVAQAVTAPPARIAENSANDNSAKKRIMDAFAQLRPTDGRLPDIKASQVNLVEPSLVATTADLKVTPKPRPKRKVAKTRIGPPTVLVAQQQPHYGFFASNSW